MAGNKARSKAKARAAAKPKSRPKPRVKPKRELKPKPKSGPGPGITSKPTAKAATRPDPKIEAAGKARQMLFADPFADMPHDLPPNVETAPQHAAPSVPAAAGRSTATTPAPEPPVSAGLEDQASFLEELIASIDTGVEEALESGGIPDLMPDEPVGETAEVQHVVFGLAGTEYAAHIDSVSEVREPLEPTPVPNVPEWVLGVASLRGDIISLVDLRAFLGVEPGGYGQRRWMLVAHAREQELSTGLIVDQVYGIRRLDPARISEPAGAMEDPIAPFLHGLHQDEGNLLAVLDFDRLLLSPKMREFSTAQEA